MYAVRCATGHPMGFRVGSKVYVNQAWRLETELTPEHEFAIKNGALQVVEVSGPEDRALALFPVEKDGVTLEPAFSALDLEQVVTGLQGTVAALEVEKRQQADVIAAQSSEIAGLQAQIQGLDARLQEVAASVATFPGETPAAAGGGVAATAGAAGSAA